MTYQIKYCEACKCNIQECLHTHHTASHTHRKNGKLGEKVELCANCHEIIHHYLGGKNIKKPKVYTKLSTIRIIVDILNKYGESGLPYWYYSIKDMQRQRDVSCTATIPQVVQ